MKQIGPLKTGYTPQIQTVWLLFVICCNPAYLTYMQSTSSEMMHWMKHKLESRLSGEISITSDRQMTPPLWQKVKKS